MKTKLVKAMILLMAIVSQSCGAPKNVTTPARKKTFGTTTVLPCADEIKNDRDNLAAIGTAYGPREEMASLLIDARTNAAYQIYQSIGHVVEGKAKMFYESMKANSNHYRQGDDIQSLEKTIIEYINSTDKDCTRVSEEVDEKGNITVFVGIQIPKAKISQAVAQELSKGESEAVQKRAEQVGKEIQAEILEIKVKMQQ